MSSLRAKNVKRPRIPIDFPVLDHGSQKKSRDLTRWKAIREDAGVGLPLSERIRLYVTTSWVGRSLDFVQMLLSLLFFALYVFKTYATGSDFFFPGMPSYVFILISLIEILLAIYFAIDYIAKLIISNDRIRFIFSLLTIVDTMTILPKFISLMIPFFNGALFGYMRILRVFRLIHSYHDFLFPNSEFSKALVRLAFTVGSLAVISAGLIQTFEEIEFHNALYFVFVTFSTVGYGDISPKTIPGRFTILIVIMLAIILVPMQTSQIISAYKEYSRFRKPFNRWISLTRTHVVVTGHIDASSLLDFLKDFFANKRGILRTKVVILDSSRDPSDELRLLVQKSAFASSLHYTHGSAMEIIDLDRVQAGSAKSVFILTDNHSENVDESDSRTVLRSLAIRRYFPELRQYVQVISPRNKVHLMAAGVGHLICVDELKMSLIARSCTCPGFSTLMANLLHSIPPEYDEGDDRWKQEYSDGLGHEIYAMTVPAIFAGVSFIETSRLIFETFEIVLFALVIPYETSSEVQISIMPADKPIQFGDIGFVIAQNEAHAHSAEVYGYENICDEIEECRETHGAMKEYTKGIEEVEDKKEFFLRRNEWTWRYDVASADFKCFVQPKKVVVVEDGRLVKVEQPESGDAVDEEKWNIHEEADEPGSSDSEDENEEVNLHKLSERMAIQDLHGENEEVILPRRLRRLQSVSYPVGPTGLQHLGFGLGLGDVTQKNQEKEGWVIDSPQRSQEKSPRFLEGERKNSQASPRNLMDLFKPYEDGEDSVENPEGEQKDESKEVTISEIQQKEDDSTVKEDPGSDVENTHSGSSENGISTNGNDSDSSSGSDTDFDSESSSGEDEQVLSTSDDGLSGEDEDSTHMEEYSDKKSDELVSVSDQTSSVGKILESEPKTIRSETTTDTIFEASLMDSMENSEISKETIPLLNVHFHEEASDDDNEVGPDYDGVLGEGKRAKNFVFLKHRKDISECTIDNAEHFTNHIIVFGRLVAIKYFLLPLRSQSLSTFHPIVILTEKGIERTTWWTIMRIPELYIVNGNPTNYNDLRRAGIRTCKSVVILSGEKMKKEEPALVDSQAIMSILAVNIFQKFAIADFVYSSNMRFLVPITGIESQVEYYNRTVYYACGRVFSSSALQSLISQAYFNPYIITIIYHFVRIFENPVGESDASVFLCDLDEELVGKTYVELFRHCVKLKMIPIGLYRYSPNLPHNFVFTNPGSGTILHGKDQVYVISQANPNP